MKILTDTHTHTNCSDHAFSTVAENLAMAKQRGLDLICMTDHAPAIPDAPHIWHFSTMHDLPKEVDGVRLLKGIEANVLDDEGHLDVPGSLLERADMVIASMHTPCYHSASKEAHTAAWMNVIQNPYVTILGHTGDQRFDFDHETVIAAAKKANKCIEINNHSFEARAGSRENCRDIALICKRLGTKIVVSSDAHNCYQVGIFDHAIAMLEEIDFPEELIMNVDGARFLAFLKEFRSREAAG